MRWPREAVRWPGGCEPLDAFGNTKTRQWIWNLRHQHLAEDASLMDSMASLSALSPELNSAVNTLLACWFFVTGACIGSFLNVVIHRVPAGKSIVHPGSHCPVCGHAIRARDNLPLLGWLILGGKCRDCRTAIPIRYPLVELFVALIFLVFGLIEIVLRAVNVPHWGPVTSELIADPRPWAICGYHLCLICTLLSIVFIEFDGQDVPIRLIVPALVVGVIGPTIRPEIMPVGYLGGPNQQPFVTSVCGATVGWLLGYALGTSCRISSVSKPGHEGLRYTLLLVGIFLGWQAVLSVGLLVAALAVARFHPWLRPRIRSGFAEFVVFASTMLYVLTWRQVELVMQYSEFLTNCVGTSWST
jgi:leader peptidase (prepilin peptidase)/N-methyltransferase